MKKHDRKKWVAHPIPIGTNLTAFADNLAERLNGLSKEGYAVEYLHVPKGVIVIGRLAEAPLGVALPVELLTRLQELIHPDDERGDGAEATEGLTPGVQRFLDVVMPQVSGRTIADVRRDVPSIIPKMLRRASIEQMHELVAEFESSLVAHDKAHKSNDCIIANVLRITAEELRKAVRRQVQQGN